jgi:hypothetical protein
MNTKHFPLNLQSGSTLSNFWNVRVGFDLRKQICHCKTVCIKRNLYLINYNCMRTQWTAKGNRDAGSSCSYNRGLHQYLRNFGGGGVKHPKPPLGTPLKAASTCSNCADPGVLSSLITHTCAANVIHYRLPVRSLDCKWRQVALTAFLPLASAFDSSQWITCERETCFGCVRLRSICEG